MGSFAQMLIDKAVGENTRVERRGFAARMIMGHLPLSQIVAYSLLDQDTVEELAFELGVIPPDNWLPPWPHTNEAGKARAATPGASLCHGWTRLCVRQHTISVSRSREI